MSRKQKEKNQRLNFSDSVKDLAAKKVNYLCSFPDCRRLTIGSHSIKNKSLNTGNAAHIYPASKGPRYDSNISKSFIESEENCIWLCPTHHTLIDRDEDKYTATTLLKWKKEAEDFANKQLEISTITFGKIQDKIKNIEFLEEIFIDYISNGKFLQLLSIINLIEEKNDDTNLIQLLTYFKIICYYYINTNLVEDEIKNFFSIDNKLMSEKLICFFIENNDKHLLLKLQMFRPDKYKDIIEIIINNQIIGKLVVFQKDRSNESIKHTIDDNIIKKLIFNYCFAEKKEYASMIIQLLLKDENIFDDNFIFKMRWTIMKLIETHLNKSFIEYDNKDYIWLKSIEDYVKKLDVNYQIDYWQFMLAMNPEGDNYKKLIETIPSSVISNPLFDLIITANEIDKDCLSNDIKTLIVKSIDANDYKVLLKYLNYQFLHNNEQLNKIFLDYSNILSYNVDILALYHLNRVKLGSPFDVNELKSGYEESYKNETVYHCILADLLHGKNKIEDSNTELLLAEQLLKDNGKLSYDGLYFYLDVIQKTESYGRAELLINFSIPLELKLKLSSVLLSSNDSNLNEKGFLILQKLYEDGIKNENIINNIGFYYFKNGHIDEARKLFHESYLIKPNDYAIKNIINIKNMNGESLTIDEISYADTSKDLDLSRLILEYYYRNNEVHKILETYYRIFSIIDKSDNYLINKFFGYIISHPNINRNPSFVQAGYTIELENNSDILFLSIHKEIEFKKLINNIFFDSIHFSESDPIITNIKFKKIGDEFVYENKKYNIKRIDTIEMYMYKKAYQILLDERQIILVKSNSNIKEDIIKSLTNLVKDRSEQQQKVIDFYDENALTPLTLLSKNIGKPLLMTMEYLFDRPKVKIANNLEYKIREKILLSYDSIIPLLRLSKYIEKNCFNRFYITLSTKSHLLLEIDNEMIDNQNLNKSGFLNTIDGKLTFTRYNEELKRNRLENLFKLKEFIKSINTISIVQNFETNDEILSILKKNDLDLEYDIFSYCINNKDFIILTDNSFFTYYAKALNLDTTGLMCLYELIDSSNLNIKDFIKILISLNFSSYFSLSLFKKIIADYNNLSVENRRIHIQNFQDILEGKLFINEEDFFLHHKKLVISLYSAYAQTEEKGGVLYNELRSKALSFYHELYPKEYEQLVERIKSKYIY